MNDPDPDPDPDATTTRPAGQWIVRPAQLRRGELRAGIVAMNESEALLQVHVGQQLPIRRVKLAVDDTTVVDGWTLTVRRIDNAGRGSVMVEVSPPADPTAVAGRP